MNTASTELSLPETILVWFLQVLGAVTAILFGAFSILSWQIANEANRLSSAAIQVADTANMIAMVALCAGGSSDASLPELCAGVQAAAEATLSQVASSYFGPMTPSSPTMTSGASIATVTQTTTVVEISVVTESGGGTVTVTTTGVTPEATTSLVLTSTTLSSSGAPGTATSQSTTTWPLTPTAESTSSGARASSDSQWLVLGLGLGIGFMVSLITGLKIWAVVKKRRRGPEVPPKPEFIHVSPKQGQRGMQDLGQPGRTHGG